jgi:hypothetical protein
MNYSFHVIDGKGEVEDADAEENGLVAVKRRGWAA